VETVSNSSVSLVSGTVFSILSRRLIVLVGAADGLEDGKDDGLEDGCSEGEAEGSGVSDPLPSTVELMLGGAETVGSGVMLGAEEGAGETVGSMEMLGPAEAPGASLTTGDSDCDCETEGAGVMVGVCRDGQESGQL